MEKYDVDSGKIAGVVHDEAANVELAGNESLLVSGYRSIESQ